MKKLMMFAAAMTIVAGAYASDCGDCDDDCSCSLVYEFKASLKTTISKAVTGDCDSSCYRKCGSAKLKGYLYVCDICGCEGFAAMKFVAQETKSDDFVFGNSVDGGVDISWKILNLIGKSDTDVEAYWSVEDSSSLWSFVAAGCGKYDEKNERIKSISGDLVAMGPIPGCEISCEDDVASSATLLCEDMATDTENTIAYGSWSIKYHKKYSETGCSCDDTMPSFKF